jgi:hypothetical protein
VTYHRNDAFVVLAASAVAILALHADAVAAETAVACSQRVPPTFTLAFDPADRGGPPLRTLARLSPLHSWGVKENLSVAAGDAQHAHALTVRFPEGSYRPGARNAPLGGAGFQLPLLMKKHATAACLAYAVRFPEGFKFHQGGKLPGLYGGSAPSGCREQGAASGFSLRYMWRRHGDGELYAYLPDREERCGKSIARGAWRFPVGRWVTLEQEAVMNDPDRANGIVRVWVDGRVVIDRSDMKFRITPDIGIAGLMFSTFFGGSDPSWASPHDQTVQFAAFRLYHRE